jgi:hypothetical protein
MRSYRCVGLIRLAVLLLVPLFAMFQAELAQAAQIVVGTHNPDSLGPGFQFDIYVTGNDQINELDLGISINGGVGPAPVITAIDVGAPGMIFAGNYFIGDAGGLPGLQPYLIIGTNFGTVLANGLLARLTFDLTGLSGGVWEISLTDNPMYGPTQFGDEEGNLFVPDITNGLLQFVPEPTGISTASCALLGVILTAQWTRRGRQAR